MRSKKKKEEKGNEGKVEIRAVMLLEGGREMLCFPKLWTGFYYWLAGSTECQSARQALRQAGPLQFLPVGLASRAFRARVKARRGYVRVRSDVFVACFRQAVCREWSSGKRYDDGRVCVYVYACICKRKDV
jgi:hypothetical protein